MVKNVKIKYVYVPADKDRPIQELTYNGPNPELGNDTFSENLKAFFATGKMPETGGTLTSKGNEVLPSIDKDVLLQNMKQQVGAENIDKLPDDMLKWVMESTQLDIFPILLPTREAQDRGLSIYVDDKGVSKKYPQNERLTALAHTVGYKTQNFLGDGFIGRVHDDEPGDIWKRTDFTIKEVSSDADWVKVAMTQVKTKGSEVENFKKLNLSSNAVTVDGSVGDGGKEVSDRKEYWSFTARDGKEEYELTFPCVTDKKKVVVSFKNKSLYVEYDGKEWLGQRSAEIHQQRESAANADSGCTVEEIDNDSTVDEVPSNLLDLPKDPKKNGALLWDAVDVEDCTWTIVDKTLQVTLCKAKEAKWDGPLKTER